MKKSEKFIVKDVANNCVLIPFAEQVANFNGIITLNDTAEFLWKNISGDFDEKILITILCEKYNIDEDTARKSALKFIDVLKEVGAIE